jgi:ADP-heptose:LPS heptosyltransferase
MSDKFGAVETIRLPKDSKVTFNTIQYLILSQLGYTLEDIEYIWNYRPDTLVEFSKDFPPEMCIIKIIHDVDAKFSIQETNGKSSGKVDFQLRMNKGTEWFMGLQHFLELYNQLPRCIRPTNILKRKINRYKGQPLDRKNLLFWMGGIGFGDILFAMPILKYLKEKYPTCWIIAALPDCSLSMVKELSFIDEKIKVPFNAKFFYRTDYQLSFDSIILKCKEAEKINIYKMFRRAANISEIELPDSKLIPEIKPDSERVIKFNKILNELKIDKFILFQLQANAIARSLPPEVSKNILDSLLEKQDMPIVIMNNLSRNEETQEFINSCQHKNKIYNLSKYSQSISDLIAVASLSKYVISVDTGVLHIAAALKKPLHGIFGAFPAKIRCETYQDCTYTDSSYPCAPCCLHGHTPCNKADSRGYSPCYQAIDINKMIYLIMREINKYESK